MPFGCMLSRQILYRITRRFANHLADSFDASSFPLPPSPSAPAPGTSLLDDQDSKFLDTFFDGMGSDDFNFDFFPSQRDGSDTGMGWTELPPTFMGTSSSFGQQPHIGAQHLVDGNFSNGLNLHMPNTRPAVPTSAASDLLAAASYLHHPPTGHSQNMRTEMQFSTHGLPPVPVNNAHRQQPLSMYTPPRSETETAEQFKDNFYTDLVFGQDQQHSTATGRQISIMNSKTDLRWGSDEAFGSPQCFVPSASQKKEVETMQIQRIKAVQEAFREVPSNTNDTTSSSPLLSRLNTDQRASSRADYQEEDDIDSSARKRRKAKFPDEVDDEDSPVSTSQKNAKRRKVGQSNDSATPPHEQGHKRRKSSAAAAKATRENLTEDQKRENHIKSEQKRRTLIREGFEDLGELVPGLRGGGFSKSAVLIMSADWLEDLLEGNEVLRTRLGQMQGR